ncbi:MAG: S8 family serine peptidase [Burkholderiales bacterium]|nr:S8 family serine peptidase [Burkholderiales bacterium]
MTWHLACRRAALALALGLAPLAACAGEDAASAPPAVAASAPRELLVMLRAPTAHARIDGSYAGGGYGDAARAQSQARVGARLAAAHGFTVVTLWALPALGMDCVVLALPPGADVPHSIAALEAHPEVEWAQAMNEFHAQGHADPLYALQPAAAQWHLDDLHAVATGRKVHVAIIDSAVDDTHPDLAQAVQARANFVDDHAWVPELHGTAVAGLVAARADNGMGIVGIAPDAQLYALRACWEVSAARTLCNSLSLAKALSFAIERRAEIINMSLSGPDDLLLGRLIDVALSHRQQVVAAVDAHVAGGGFPAAHPGVIAVADVQSDAPPAGLPGAWAAPARDLPTTAPGGGWRMVTGTSFAAGEVSGLLAVMGQAQARADRSATLARLVRLPGGGIDACASLLNAAQPANTNASAVPGCRALLAAVGPSANMAASP